MHNVIIIGSGPAAHTAAVYTARANLEPLLFEGELSQDILPGGQLMTTTDVENYPGFPEGISGPEMMERFRQQSVRFGTRIEPRTVSAVDLSRRPFSVRAESDAWQTRALIIATGAMAKWLGLPSEEVYMNRGVSACATCDGFFYRGQDVCVIGGGNTAVEEALYLANIANTVTLIHRRDTFRAEKIMVDKLMQRVAEGKIILKLNATLEDILGNDMGVTGARLLYKDGSREDLTVSGVFIAIGHQPNTEIFKGQLDMDATGYLKTRGGSADNVGATNIEGVWAAGDVKDHTYRQAVTSAASGCQAALDAERWLDSQH